MIGKITSHGLLGTFDEMGFHHIWGAISVNEEETVAEGFGLGSFYLIYFSYRDVIQDLQTHSSVCP